MINVMKAQIYQLKKNRLLFLIFLGVNAIVFAIGAMMILPMAKTNYSGDEYVMNVQASYFVALFWSMGAALVQLIPAAAAGMICAGDFKDKTSNYEIMSGRLRLESYAGRVVLSLIVSMILSTLTLIITPIILTAMVGWGDTVTIRSVVIRVLASMFPIFKMTCFCCMLSFIIKKPAIVMTISFAGTIVASYIINTTGSVNDSSLTIFAPYNLGNILMYHYYLTYGLNNKEMEWMIFENELASDLLVRSVCISLIMGIAYIIIGYHYHHKDDLN